ncbi:MAG: hypothetical protein HRT57_00695 [Crocinitomicaceae bacterium]|nr:hypothetical protein [Crocinitomicaceae bacterium]
MSNFTLVYTVTSVILFIYLVFLIAGLVNKNIDRKMKVWMVVEMLAIAGLSNFILSYSQQLDKMDRLNYEMEQ